MEGSGKEQPPAYESHVYPDLPPPYTPQENQMAPVQQILQVDKNSQVFSKHARFDGISQPSIPPPPPGCMPNQYQLMQMNGPINVVVTDGASGSSPTVMSEKGVIIAKK